ncbi:4-carboxymuconolactone decarboxylase [Photobacterium jeanii]|uniref:4-carboxymuconolactone decarboxylase n=1 Tax=Photobacterium jeanii TaxID=858640 RepID=A0A178KNH2_9GAMM|nr:carboxymuconolactone decarboxylase family protein [Photobacterium jeanii]OAN18791.1 4-carboxymuconolactone decarboxylase [Photobacterium jeanii]PST92805.1 carboxymuconolactone decarboxylase family protein [Photobacterium jeanii]
MNDRYQRGYNKLNELEPNGAEGLMEAFADVCPDLAKYTIEYPFGDVLQRDGLDFKTRELVTIGALTAMGNCQPQLHGHIVGALNLGCSEKEISEVILQMSVYAGFPAAINGMTVAKAAFAEFRNKQEAQ